MTHHLQFMQCFVKWWLYSAHINGSFKLIMFNSMSHKTFQFKSIPYQLGLVDNLVFMIFE